MRKSAIVPALILAGMTGGMMEDRAPPLPSMLETQPPEVDAIRIAKAEEKRRRKASKVRR